MRIQDIILERETEGNTVERTGPLSFTIGLAPNQRLALKSFVTGELTIESLFTHKGDTLIFKYELDQQTLGYEILLVNTVEREKRLPEDGQFDLESEEDVEFLKKDISVKMELFKNILDPRGLSVVTSVYQRILRMID